MRGGFSTSVGIVFYDTEKTGENAVFCFFENGEPFFKKGERSALLEEMKASDSPNKSENKSLHNKTMLFLLLFLLGIIAAVWIFFGGFFSVFGAFLFFVISYFPLLVLLFAAERLYPDDEKFHQFRRFHGAKHTIIEYSGKKNRTFELSKIRKTSFYHRECGTVYAAETILFAVIIGIAFALIPKIGFLWFLGITVLSFILLFLNLLNPHNPLMIFQRFAVEKPGDRELFLAAAGIKILDGIE